MREGEYRFGQEWVFPQAIATLEAPDLFVSRPTAPAVDAATIVGLLKLAGEVMAKNPHFYWLCGFGDLTGFGAEVRKEIASLPPIALRAYVTFGGSVGARTLANLMVHGLKLLNRLKGDTAFLKSEAEARAWIAAHRSL